MGRRSVRTGRRRIDYLELGDPGGVPAVYLHGTPSSASEARWLEEHAVREHVRIVALDRAGYLGSERLAEPTVAAGARDALAVADAIGLARFAVVGFSGGSGYAIALAQIAPERVTVAHVGGALGSLADLPAGAMPLGRRAMFAFVAGAPVVSRPLLRLVYRRIGGRLRSRLSSPADAARYLFAGPARGAQLAAVERYAATSDEAGLAQEICDYVAALGAIDAIVDDVTAYRRPWPFRMADLAVPLVFWHGSADPAAPAAVAGALAAQSPVASARIFDGEGHFVFHSHGADIVASIADAHTPSRGVA